MADVPASFEARSAPQSINNGTSCGAHQYPSGWRLAIIIFPLCLGTLLVAIDQTIIAVAIPKITTVFDALDDVGWYGSAYLLTVTTLQPTFGSIYKYFHVKTTYLISVAIFEVGSTLCAAAPNSPTFIVGRAIAGVGAGGLVQGALCIIAFTVPLVKRPLYIGIVVSVFGLATCFGPILGGAFTSNVSWRWCFYINLPLGGLTFILLLGFLKLKVVDDEDRALPTKSKLLHIDVLGAALFIAAVSCLLLALQWGGTSLPWKSAKVIGLFVGFALLIIAFCVLQWKLKENATIPPRVMRQRSILMGCCYAFFINMSNYTTSYYMPFYFQAVQSVSATTSGIRFIPLALPEVFMIVVAGAIVTKTGYYIPFMVLGLVIGAVGTGLLTTIGLTTSTVQWAAYLVVTGLGIGIGLQLPYTAVQVVLSESDIPTGNALMVFFAQFGGAISIPVGETIFTNSLLKEVASHTTIVSPQALINAGPTNLRILTDSQIVLRALQDSYSISVTNTLYLALAALIVALPFALSMEWKNVKKTSVQRLDNETSTNIESKNEKPQGVT